MTAAGDTTMSSSQPQPRKDVWLTVVDEAVTRVVDFLVATRQPLNADAPLTRDMLRLLDRRTLHDIAHERNSSGRCARPGCALAPRDTHYGDVDTSGGDDKSSHVIVLRKRLPRRYACDDNDDDSDGDDTSDEDDGAASPAVTLVGVGVAQTRSSNSNNKACTDDAEAVVYDDDVYARESFRLAARQQQQLARLRAQARRARRAHAQAQRNDCDCNDNTSAVVYRGVSFCSAECVDVYRSELRARVARVRDYTHDSLLTALHNLFPALSRPLLRRVATSHVAWAAPGVQRDVTERDVADGDSAAHDTNTTMTTTTTTSSDHDVDDDDACSLRSVMQRMQVLEHVWRAETTTSTAAQRRQVASYAAAATTAASARLQSSLLSSPAVSHASAVSNNNNDDSGSGVLCGALFVVDYCMSIGSERTYASFVQRYAAQRAAMRECVARCRALADSGNDDDDDARARAAMLLRVTAPTLRALDAAATAKTSLRQQHDDDDDDDDDDAATSLHAHQQRRRRRELFVACVLGSDVTAALSRLLLVDLDALVTLAWQRVWCTAYTTHNNTHNNNNISDDSSHTLPALIATLQLDSALPAVLQRPARLCAERLTLGLVFVLAAACVSPCVWDVLARRDSDVALAPLLRAAAVRDDDVAAALHALVVNVYGDEKGQEEVKADSSA